MHDFLTGNNTMNMTSWENSSVSIHRDIELPLGQMKEAASKSGMEIYLLSGFRSFEAQLKIWNDKCAGLRPILDDDNNIIEIENRSPWETIQSIMRFSAIPGASRHHWGCDLDVVDRKAYPSEDFQVQLTPDEFRQGGPFAKLDKWMSENLQQFGFFRPYNQDRGGLCPEAWHISYAPLSQRYSQLYDLEFFLQFLQSPLAQKITFHQELLDHGEEIFKRFIQV